MLFADGFLINHQGFFDKVQWLRHICLVNLNTSQIIQASGIFGMFFADGFLSNILAFKYSIALSYSLVTNKLAKH